MNILMIDYKRQLILDKIKSKDKQGLFYLMCKTILKKTKILDQDKELLIKILEDFFIIERNSLFRSWIYDFIENEI